jgi:ribosomal protein L40E
MTDDGEGFYRICNYCDANMPADASKCVKCGQNTGLPAEKKRITDFNHLPQWIVWLLHIAVFILLLGFSVVILYFSFYLLIAVFVIGFAVFLFNMLLPRR